MGDLVKQYKGLYPLYDNSSKYIEVPGASAVLYIALEGEVHKYVEKSGSLSLDKVAVYSPTQNIRNMSFNTDGDIMVLGQYDSVQNIDVVRYDADLNQTLSFYTGLTDVQRIAASPISREFSICRSSLLNVSSLRVFDENGGIIADGPTNETIRRSIIYDNEGFIWTAGPRSGTGGGTQNLSKYTNLGSRLFVRDHTRTNSIAFTRLVIGSDIYLVHIGVFPNVFFRKYDTNGTLLFQGINSTAFPTGPAPSNLLYDEINDVYWFTITAGTNPANRVVRKLSLNGTTWTLLLTIEKNVTIEQDGAKLNKNGDIYLASGNELLKYDTNGNLLITKTFSSNISSLLVKEF
jgi:hypothetical protein